jgi:serine phosphatase RsbU (regulator of sigma subunit)/Tfp pilus assembly protein PilF
MKKRLLKQLFFGMVALSVLFFSGSQIELPDFEVNGITTYSNKPVGNVIISVYEDSLPVNQMLGKRNGKFDVFLDYQKEYVLEFAKEGFVTKQIAISTKVPEKVIMEGGTGFYDLHVEMVEMIKGLNTALFDHPVTRYIFDEGSYFYIRDEKFENQISGKLAKVDAQIENLKKQEYQRIVKTGDELLAGKDYENAWAAYQKALNYSPEEPYPSSQLKKLKKLIKQEVSNDEGYQSAIAKADKNFNDKAYLTAAEYYEKSLIYKPKESYPANKIAEIDSINSSIFFEKKKSYENELTLAKSYMISQDYSKARISLENALAIMPEDAYASQKLAETEELIKRQNEQIALQKQKESDLAEHEYSNLIHTADSLMLSGNYAKAKSLFQKANSQKPDDKYPVGKIREIEKIQDEKAKEEAGSAPQAMEETKKPASGVVKKDEVKPAAEVPEKKKIITSPVEADIKISGYLEEAKVKMERGEDKAASSLYNDVGNLYHDNNQIGKALEFYEKSLEIKKKTDDTAGIPVVLNDMAVALYDTGKYENAIDKYKEAFSLTQQTGNKKISAIILNNIAQVYENTFQYENALNYYQQSVEITNELQNKNEAAVLYEKIADVHFERNEFDKAIENLQQTLKIDEELKDESKVGATLNNMGIAYQSLGRKEDAIDYYNKSLDITEKQGDKLQVSIALNNIGNVNFDWQKFNEAIAYYEKSIRIKEDIDYKTGLALSLHNIGNAYKALRNYSLALSFYKKSNDLASEINYQEVMARNYKAFAEIYSLTNDYKNAFEYQKLFADSRHIIRDERTQMPEGLKREQVTTDKLMIASLQRQIQRQKLLAELEANQRLKEIEIKNLELENQQAKIKRMGTLIVSAVLLFVIVAVFLFIVYKQFLQKKKANVELTEKNQLISFQKQQITDSIRYASKIQRAVLPPREFVTKIVPQHFILNKPRDIVSGDYYWTTQRGNESIIAVADCTGHGVPGAFMSMLGIAFLNEIVNRSSKTNSHEILDQLRSHVMKSLHQTGKENESKDGMDIALCIIDMQKKELQFSGAHNPLYLIRKKELTEIKADRMPIGISLRYNQPFKCHRLSLQKDDLLYIFSDGYYDQFGGPNKKKYSMRRFRELLLEIHQEPMEQQQILLEQNFLEWRGPYDQLDDILVMGIKMD